MTIANSNRELDEELKEKSIEIVRVTMDLEKSRKKITAPMINTFRFQCFIAYTHSIKFDLISTQLS